MKLNYTKQYEQSVHLLTAYLLLATSFQVFLEFGPLIDDTNSWALSKATLKQKFPDATCVHFDNATDRKEKQALNLLLFIFCTKPN